MHPSPADVWDELRRLRALVAAIPDPVYRIRRDGTFVHVEVPDRAPDASPQDLVPGQSVQTVMPPRQAAAVLHAIGEALDGDRLATVEYDFEIDGERRWWEGRIVPAGPNEVLAIVREITDRRRTEVEAYRRARTDPLTGLANRVAFEEALEAATARARRSGRRVALLYCDLDGFKVVNDRAGHPVGDIVLAEAARRLAGELREIDLAARIGGDEIVVLVEEFDSHDDLLAVGSRLVAAAARTDAEAGHRVGLSVGVAIYPDHADSAFDLVGAADRAMYRAKQAGGSTVELAASWS